MEIKTDFFSRDNLSALTNKLGSRLGVEDQAQSDGCRELLKSQMKIIFEKNKGILNKAPAQKVLKHLNEKSIELCTRIFNEKMNKQRSSKSMGQYSMNRETEVYGDRRNKVQRRPSGGERRGGQREMVGMMDDISGGGGGSYAPIQSGQGEFIAADGSMGKKFLQGVNMNDFLKLGSKKDIAGELERRMLERTGDYDNGAMMDMGGGGMGNMGGGNMMGMGNMGGNMQYNPNMGGRQQRQEMDFSLDGSGVKKTRDSQGNPIDDQMDPNLAMMMGMGGGNMGGMGNMSGGFGGMDPMGMGMVGGSLGGDMQYNPNMGMGGGSLGGDMQYNPNMGMGGGNVQYNPNMNMGGGNMQYTPNIENVHQPRMMQNNFGQQRNDNFNTQQDNNMQMNQMMMAMMQMNPAMMQQMMQQMGGNRNFQMGGEGGNDLEAMTQINNDLKRSVANQLGINPQNVINMSSEEIGRLAERVKNQNNNSESDKSEQDSDDSLGGKKRKSSKQKTSTAEMLKALLELKSKNNKVKKDLNKTVVGVVNKLGKKKAEPESEESEEEKPKPKKTVKIVEPKKKKEESESESDESEKPRPRSTKSTLKSVPKKKTTNMTLTIECDKIEEDPNNYNDYMVDFKNEFGKDLSDIANITLTSVNVPFMPNIDEESNKLSIVYNDECNELEFEIDDQNYNINEIIDQINESMNELETGIVAKLKSGKVIMEQQDDEEFEIICNENSIAKYLGFSKKKYSGKSQYISENETSFINGPIYLYLKNLSQNEPFAILHSDGNYEQKFKLSQNIPKMSCIILQFKSENKKLVNFAGTPHTLSFSFDILE